MRPRIWAHWREFDYVVINDQFEQALEDLQAIVENRGSRLLARSGPKWCIWRRDWLILEQNRKITAK